MTGRCCDCLYWKPSWGEDGEEGQCRRYPPTTPCVEEASGGCCPRGRRVSLVELRGVALTDHPLVLWDGWCGEWKERE